MRGFYNMGKRGIFYKEVAGNDDKDASASRCWTSLYALPPIPFATKNALRDQHSYCGRSTNDQEKDFLIEMDVVEYFKGHDKNKCKKLQNKK